jgi:hypothetical protein
MKSDRGKKDDFLCFLRHFLQLHGKIGKLEGSEKTENS